jgi:hypothetical protein
LFFNKLSISVKWFIFSLVISIIGLSCIIVGNFLPLMVGGYPNPVGPGKSIASMSLITSFLIILVTVGFIIGCIFIDKISIEIYCVSLVAVGLTGIMYLLLFFSTDIGPGPGLNALLIGVFVTFIISVVFWRLQKRVDLFTEVSRNKKKQVSIIIVLIVISIVIVSVLYLPPTNGTGGQVFIEGSLAYQSKSMPIKGNVIFLVTITRPVNSLLSDVSVHLLNPSDHIVDCIVNWTHMASDNTHLSSGDFLTIEKNNTDIRGYEVYIRANGYAGTIGSVIPSF